MTYRESASRPFYSINYEDDTDLLLWLNDLYLFRCSDGDECQRIEKQTTHLALYLNYSPANSQRAFSANSSGSLRIFEKRDYYHLIDPLIKDIVNNWVSRITARRPTFAVTPQRSDDPVIKVKASKSRALLEAKFQEQHSAEMDEMNVRNLFIFGESYLEVFWDPSIGPLDKDVQKYLDSDEDEAYKDLGKIADQIRIGDVGFKLHDPRNVIVQRARSYKEADWVLLLEAHPTDCLKAKYVEYADRITETNHTRVFGHDILSPSYERGQTILFKFYHRPTLECPQGYIVEATPDIILKRCQLPAKRWIKNARFPVLQAVDLELLGSSRGSASTIMDATVSGQIALNNLWIQALTNIALFSPKLLLQKGSVDVNHLRIGDRNIVQYGKSQAPPSIMAQEVVSQSHLLMIDKLRDRIQKTANVMPVTRGESMPNVESRRMLDFVAEQQTMQSIPKDTQHARFLKDWATLTLELMADKYEGDTQRTVQYFGKNKRTERLDVTGEDLQVDVDIFIDNGNAFTGTLQGKMQQIQEIMQIVPGYYTPAEIVDILEIGSADKVKDDITATIDNAQQEIKDLLQGKKIQAPRRTLDLLTYYDTYVREINKKEVKELIPDIHEPHKKDPGNQILTQIAAIEMLILEMMDEKAGEMNTPLGAIPVKKADVDFYAPQLGVPPQGVTLRKYLSGRHPEFPRVYKPDALSPVNPFEIEEQAIQAPIDPQQGQQGAIPEPSVEGPNPSTLQGNPEIFQGPQ